VVIYWGRQLTNRRPLRRQREHWILKFWAVLRAR
jgi:hypothetical protein